MLVLLVSAASALVLVGERPPGASLARPRTDAPRIDTHRHAAELRDRGFTVITDAGLAGIADAKAACNAEFARLQDGVARLGLDPVEDKYAFAEIATRHRKRWGFQPSDPSAWTQLVTAAVGVASPVIEELHALEPHADDGLPGLTGWTRHALPSRPALQQVDAIVSAPGAKAQRFHADAGARHLA